MQSRQILWSCILWIGDVYISPQERGGMGSRGAVVWRRRVGAKSAKPSEQTRANESEPSQSISMNGDNRNRAIMASRSRQDRCIIISQRRQRNADHKQAKRDIQIVIIMNGHIQSG